MTPTCPPSCRTELFCRQGGRVPPDRTRDVGEMPTELAGNAGSRLTVAAALATVFVAVLAGSAALVGNLSWPALAAAAALAAASLGMIRLIRRQPSPISLAKWGSLYLLGTSVGIAAVEFATAPSYTGVHGVSWNAVWVAFFPMLIPCSPRHTLTKSLIAATATPVMFAAIAPLRSLPMPDAVGLLVLFVPVYLAAGMAYVSARFLDRLGGDLRQAREMGMYELEEQLATGGMGEVWRARHRLLARPAAIKLVKPRGPNGESQLDAVSRARFEREAQVTAALQSPHTVQLYDFGVTSGGVFYYVMELLDGMDLDQLVRAHGPLPPARVVHIIKQALESLAEAHARGLVHRDIKPANIYLSKRGIRDDFVRVLDFGLVRQADSHLTPDSPRLTGDNEVSGTPAFMAPEIITGQRPVDGRADLYALACVAYWLLTGELLFNERTSMGLAIAHATETPLPPSRRAGVRVPSDLEAVIMRCLEKDPDDRPASAEELLELLDACEVEQWQPADARNWWRDTGEHAAVSPIELLM